MRLRKGVRLKAPTVYAIPSSEARGLQALSARLKLSSPHGRYSGQSSLSATEQREQASAMSVALAQPHRANVYDTRGNLIASADDKRLGTALGRFCARHRPRPLAPWLYDAGEEYGRIIYEFRKKIEANTIKQASEPLGLRNSLTDEAMAELATRRWEEARDVLDAVDNQAATKLEYVCHDDRDAPVDWSTVMRRGLQALADHFKLAPRNFRDGDDFC